MSNADLQSVPVSSVPACVPGSHARMRDCLVWYHSDAFRYELREVRDQLLYLKYWRWFLQKCCPSRGRGRRSHCGRVESVAVERSCKENISGCLKGSCDPTLYEWLQMHLVCVICATVWAGGCAGSLLQRYNQEGEENMNTIKCSTSIRAIVHL